MSSKKSCRVVSVSKQGNRNLYTVYNDRTGDTFNIDSGMLRCMILNNEITNAAVDVNGKIYPVKGKRKTEGKFVVSVTAHTYIDKYKNTQTVDLTDIIAVYSDGKRRNVFDELTDSLPNSFGGLFDRYSEALEIMDDVLTRKQMKELGVHTYIEGTDTEGYTGDNDGVLGSTVYLNFNIDMFRKITRKEYGIDIPKEYLDNFIKAFLAYYIEGIADNLDFDVKREKNPKIKEIKQLFSACADVSYVQKHSVKFTYTMIQTQLTKRVPKVPCGAIILNEFEVDAEACYYEKQERDRYRESFRPYDD